jgi:ribosome-interacting GTPase 1
MAVNLTPMYHEADAKYRAARTPEEKLAALEEMWRELPKHKSSEKLQAELKKKLSAARKAVHHTGKKGPSKADPYAVPKSGAGQIVLVGAPNVGKSSLVAALTNAHVKVTDYPFGTALPQPGMAPFEDIQIQLVDTPPITADHVAPGLPGLWHTADALLMIADLASDDVLEDVEMCMNHLTERHVELVNGPPRLPDEESPDFRIPGVLLANKNDAPSAAENLAMLREFFGERVRIEPISTQNPNDLARLPRLLFELVRVIRVYAKPPGKKPDMEDPFVLPAGSDIHELARKVHRGLEHGIKSARLWGAGVVDGQNVHLDHLLHDKDIVELHT